MTTDCIEVYELLDDLRRHPTEEKRKVIHAAIDEHKGGDGPGRFEGEPLWVVYYDMCCMDGCSYENLYQADDDFGWSSSIQVIYEFKPGMVERILFPEIAEEDKVFVYYDSSGFIGALDGRVAEEMIAEYTNFHEEEYPEEAQDVQ